MYSACPTAYRQGIKLCPNSAEGFQSLISDMVQKRSLAFLCIWPSGNLAEQQQQSMEVKQEYLAPEAEILFINKESVVLNTSDIANGFDEDGIIDDLSDQLWWN